ncbi:MULTISPECIES: adenosylmethionine--8-amino-7-oxononanoate transaminase [unclassified Agarivorans]|uniref:adenosylmethionine--8-amino-7-oxononanoate transaminase n=1 Tax=unclassified Agarivorans TaxID=2636026 RepID=UPI0026E23D81|nr:MULTISPECIES: adenosylmethionine--8-amino-7-oxononanoate transaminase [unclassified Agarivorans]MDO6687778.1 adenosylmethionine--8-amino-7-oxononanoate transaminase [Agarivorans sp. 3_MG-2023]MDO6717358.1 adenosylmethionine--8-amino-7-oxononanoate transaminase [Agarivorans sp. 2_MG-2023]
MSIDLHYDQQHLWHPYTSSINPIPCYPVASAEGCEIELENGQRLVDGMASWWACIHGYKVAQLDKAASEQLSKMSHVMFGGLTHQPAVDLAKHLVALSPGNLEQVFISDSGSVAVEVALKMALQYWHAKGEKRAKFATVRNGYHGDTFGAMSVCDPQGGMHQLYQGFLPEHLFCEAPQIGFNEPWQEQDIAPMKTMLDKHHKDIAAVIIEPVVQGAGGMRIFHPQYLSELRALCDHYGLLLVADEIATGFGRTGKLFACEHANITPDILCLGKGLTGGYMSLAATLTSKHVADTICGGEAGVFMHGPTFMGNPLACAVANASIKLLLDSNWQARVAEIEQQLKQQLNACRQLSTVADVRVLGAIGVVETKTANDLASIQAKFVELGVWIRPFGKLVYIMPPYTISETQLAKLCSAIYQVLSD